MIKYSLVYFVTWIVLTTAIEVIGQDRKPWSIADIEDLVRGEAPSQSIVERIEKNGVNFEFTEENRNRLERAGAEDSVLRAVQQAAQVDKKRKDEEERRKKRDEVAAAEKKRKSEENARRAAEEEVRRKEKERLAAEEEQRRAEENRKKEAEEASKLNFLIKDPSKLKGLLEDVRKREGLPLFDFSFIFDLIGMIEVPVGLFFMGCDTSNDTCVSALKEKPGRLEFVDTFRIDKTEVTVAAYAECVKAGACDEVALRKPGTIKRLAKGSIGSNMRELRMSFTVPKTKEEEEPESACNWGINGREQHPINCVDHRQASAYCQWKGKRLPTDVEWEKAARGIDGRRHSWGNGNFVDVGPVANVADETLKKSLPDWLIVEGYTDGFVRTAPVGSFPKGVSSYGVLDMSGNVAEWTEKQWEDGEIGRVFYGTIIRPIVLRGSSWNDFGDSLISDLSLDLLQRPRSAIGFRCAQ